MLIIRDFLLHRKYDNSIKISIYIEMKTKNACYCGPLILRSKIWYHQFRVYFSWTISNGSRITGCVADQLFNIDSHETYLNRKKNVPRLTDDKRWSGNYGTHIGTIVTVFSFQRRQRKLPVHLCYEEGVTHKNDAVIMTMEKCYQQVLVIYTAFTV